ncbi:MAG: hypothetical protein HPY73_00385 [Methanomassiliicoccales archaeon]|nr:MAG: hypothetical protein HPY73_00385 [Methanomassiliicoccales archaeon]
MTENDLELLVDDAHLTALDLSTHILEHANAFRLLSFNPDYLGRRRLRYMILLIMFDEVGKLMEIMKDCERAVTAKDPYVRVRGFFSSNKKGEAFENILKELSKSEMLYALFKRVMGRPPSNVDFEMFKEELIKGSEHLDSQLRAMMYYDIRGRSDGSSMIPEDKVVDMLFEAIVMNVEGAREFIHEWARAKELDLTYILRPIKVETCPGIKLWTKEGLQASQKDVRR